MDVDWSHSGMDWRWRVKTATEDRRLCVCGPWLKINATKVTIEQGFGNYIAIQSTVKD